MRTLTLSLGVIVVSLAATFACTNASTVGENLSTDNNRQTKGDGGSDAAPDATNPPSQPDAAPPPPPKNCTGQGGSSGSDGKGTFACGEVYSCDGQEVSIECSCGPNNVGSCKCGDGTTFAHDCVANGCSNTNAERAQCGLPPHPPPSSSGGSSGSTSSSTGGSTSSSSGASGSTSSSGGSTSGGP